MQGSPDFMCVDPDDAKFDYDAIDSADNGEIKMGLTFSELHDFISSHVGLGWTVVGVEVVEAEERFQKRTKTN
jgi:hypothetical protein